MPTKLTIVRVLPVAGWLAVRTAFDTLLFQFKFQQNT